MSEQREDSEIARRIWWWRTKRRMWAWAPWVLMAMIAGAGFVWAVM